MSSRPTAVEVYTTSHRIVGHLFPGPQGLFAFLNRATESAVEVQDVQVHALHQDPAQGESCPSLWMVKAEMAVIAVGARGEIGATGGARGGYTKPFPHRVRILLEGYEIRGWIETAGKLDFGAVVLEGERYFVPAYESTLQAVLFPRVQLEAGGLLFNRNMVQAISVLQRGQSMP
jgi:hypothetical protein